MVTLLTIHILKVDLANEVGYGAQVDHPGGSGVLQEVQQKVGEQEVAWEVEVGLDSRIERREDRDRVSPGNKDTI